MVTRIGGVPLWFFVTAGVVIAFAVAKYVSPYLPKPPANERDMGLRGIKPW